MTLHDSFVLDFTLNLTIVMKYYCIKSLLSSRIYRSSLFDHRCIAFTIIDLCLSTLSYHWSKSAN